MNEQSEETHLASSQDSAQDAGNQALEGFVTVPDRVLLQTVADEVVFLNLDNGTYYGLDPIGARMLHLAMRLDDVSAVAMQMEEEYETTVDVLERDVDHLLNELSTEGLIVRHDVEEPDLSPDDPADAEEGPSQMLSPDDGETDTQQDSEGPSHPNASSSNTDYQPPSDSSDSNRGT